MRSIKYFRYLFLLGIITGLIYLLSCSEGTNPKDKKFELPEKDLSFYEDIEPLFNARCGLESGCHSPTDYTNPLLYTELVTRDGLVYHQLSSTGQQLVDLENDPLNPESAILYLILYEGYPDVEDIMPPFPYDRLTTNQLNGIKQWIREEAPE
ncbi:MAG: hypothetical protein P8Y99_13570 [Calditrichaceae bacterium]